MSNLPSELQYTTSHEWIRVTGDTARIGITDHAQSELGDIVHFEPPEAGSKVAKGDAVAEIESVKAVSDVYSPLSGEIVAFNEGLDDDTADAVNSDPYGDGWLFEVKLSNPGELDGLLDATAYAQHVDSES